MEFLPDLGGSIWWLLAAVAFAVVAVSCYFGTLGVRRRWFLPAAAAAVVCLIVFAAVDIVEPLSSLG